MPVASIATPVVALDPSVCDRLAVAAGLPLAAFRPEHVARQVDRALELEGVGFDGLVRRLTVDERARSRFRASVAVSVSARQRDPEQLDLVEATLLPELLTGTGPLRVWSAGCANGSELLDLAAMLTRSGALERAHLLGSDLLGENLVRAEAQAETAEPGVRRRVRWERRDLASPDAPAGRWHLILCRNVVIYLAPEAKRVVHRHLAEALTPGGILMVGRSERIADPPALGLVGVAPHAYRKVG